MEEILVVHVETDIRRFLLTKSKGSPPKIIQPSAMVNRSYNNMTPKDLIKVSIMSVARMGYSV